jgi:hypothetical protein
VNAVIDVDGYMYDPLARRLWRLEIATPDALLRLGDADSRPGRRPGARGRTVRYAWQLGAATMVVVTAVVISSLVRSQPSGPLTRDIPGYTIEVAAGTAVTPRMTRDQAIAVAFSSLAQHPITSAHGRAFTGFQVTTAVFEGNVLKVWHQCGAHWYLDSPENLWVIDMRAPPQSGVADVQATVLVDDATGTGKPRYSDALIGLSGPNASAASISHKRQQGC